MFAYCSSLISINLANLNTKNSLDMNNMFFGSSKLISINFSSFNTKNVKNMNNMFYIVNH